MHAVGRMGKELGPDTREVVTALLQGLNDNVVEVRVAVLETFGNLGQEALGDDARAVLERVTALTKDGQKDVREAAENALKKLKM
jgi:HEAT repeat protein